jgi:uncharacterized protein YraI
MRAEFKGVLVASLLLTWPAVAQATPAQVETDLNVRLGPGTDYGVVDVIPVGTVVDVLACYSGWCEIGWEGYDGFASRGYLDIPESVTVVAPRTEALVVPGVVVYEARYYHRPVWARGGRIIRHALRRDFRRDVRRDIRRDRREARHDIHIRRDWREARQDRRRFTSERRRTDRAEVRHENARRHIERRSRMTARDHQRRNRAAELRHEHRNAVRTHQRRNAIASVRHRSAERARAQARDMPPRIERSHMPRRVERSHQRHGNGGGGRRGNRRD